MIKYKHNRGHLQLFMEFLVPVVVYFCFESLILFGGWPRLLNLFENLLFAFSLTILLYVWPQKFRYFYCKAAFCILVFSLFLETLYYLYFGTIFSSSAIYIFIETNLPEIKEFLASHMNLTTFVALIFLATILLYGLKRLPKFKNLIETYRIPKLYLLLSLLLIFSFLKFSTLIIYNVPYLLVKAPINYFQDMKSFEYYGTGHTSGNFSNVSLKNPNPNKKLYVIVIGESTSKTHFGLYDYYRETSPQLSAISDQLTICEDVISPHSYTIATLTKSLTLGNTEKPEKISSGSIIQLLNQAGFDTYWVSNQRPLGISETQVTKIALGASKTSFLNTKHTDEITPYDQVLVKALKEIVASDGNSKVVFLHMIGTHIKYKNRCPVEFKYFKDRPQGKFVEKNNEHIINQYDDDIRYNDFVLRQIIDTVKDENLESFVLYTSDHGEEVFDNSKFFGHVDGMITKSLFEIPMLLWQSKQHRALKPLPQRLPSKYMIDDLFHSIADLCLVESDEVDTTRSIFNKAFIEKKRLINDKIEYDSIINILQH